MIDIGSIFGIYMFPYILMHLSTGKRKTSSFCYKVIKSVSKNMVGKWTTNIYLKGKAQERKKYCINMHDKVYSNPSMYDC